MPSVSLSRPSNFPRFLNHLYRAITFGQTVTVSSALGCIAVCTALLLGLLTVPVSAQSSEIQVLSFTGKPTGGSLQLYFTGEETTPLVVNMTASMGMPGFTASGLASGTGVYVHALQT